MPGEGRHLATVLFLDIVGSTPIADELGDVDWRQLLGRFRSVVRADLRGRGGHEVDITGDGVFATFTEPLAALRAGRAITTSVQDLGLDVRIGLHTGDVEVAAKHVSGITVHIGARVMALAGPAQILVTSTIRDMERGAALTFEDAGEHTLKGVEGRWRLFSVGAVEGEAPPAPLEPNSAAERRRAIASTPSHRRARLAITSVLCLVVVGTALLFARPHGSAPAPPAAPTRPVMLKIDLASHTIQGAIEIPTVEGSPYWAPGDIGGEIARASADAIEFRDLASGELLDTRRIPGWQWVSYGAGSVWVDSMAGAAEPYLLRIDPRTGRVTGRSSEAGGGWNLWWGAGGGWSYAISDTGRSQLVQIDPVTLDATTWPIPSGDWQGALSSRRGVWMFDPYSAQIRVAWFDLRTHETRPLRVPHGEIVVAAGPDAYNLTAAFLFDPDTETLTPLVPGRLATARAFGVVGAPTELLYPRRSFLFGSVVDDTLWIAAYGQRNPGERAESVDSAVVGVPLDHEGAAAVVVRMPAGFEAQHTLGDPAHEALWVNSCYCGTAY